MEINGNYKVCINLPMGKQEAILKLETEENRLQGSITVMENTLEITEGKANGSMFEFGIELKTPIGLKNITFRGYVDGEKITGSFKIPFGKSSFEGIKIV